MSVSESEIIRLSPVEMPRDETVLQKIAHMVMASEAAITHEEAPSIDDPYIVKYFDDWGERRDFGLIARRGATILGAGWYRADKTQHDSVLQLQIGVLPEAQRQGYGRQLLAGLDIMARSRNEMALMLVVDQRNTAAQQLYRKAGFIIIQELTIDATLQVYTMAKAF